MNAGSHLDPARLREAAEKRFHFWRNVCGCQVGALLLLATLGYRLPTMLRTPDWTWIALAAEGGIALLAALIGKFLAIGGARLLLIADVALFQRRLRHMFSTTVEI